MWVSKGTINLDKGTEVQPPGSTSSLLTIHLRKRFSLLQALPLSGEGSRLNLPFLEEQVLNFPTKAERAGRIVSSLSLKQAVKQA
jgi:hypothetical protein